ncbi:hypothetical protein M9Y10_011265 [Tritrichomonas musculus]|uniref:Bromo domain-containing protein n=1 Tax=Tritrichomonas musculus TaxID=1915356 RepID=A0ABR2IJ04_9EUKA
MDNEMSFSEIAEKLNVKEPVIDYLSTILPFKDSFDFIISTNNNELFWNLIDLLPRHYAMHLHSIDIEIPTTSKDFPRDFISPTIQSFWASNIISQGKSPTIINSRSISRIYSSGLRNLLKQGACWSLEEDSQRVNWEKDANINFDIDLLCNICNSYMSNGLPWLFLEISELRSAYNQVYQFLSTINDRHLFYKVRKIEDKLKNLAYSSSEEIKQELGEMLPDEIAEFNVPSELINDIRTLMYISRDSIMKQAIDPIGQSNRNSDTNENNASDSDMNIQTKGLGPCPPSMPPIDEWTRTRTEALVNQMTLPLQQRNSFQMTPSIFSARMGQSFSNGDNKNDSPFEPLSLSELLFSDASGNVAPMPYISCKVELPSQSYTAFCKSSLKRFVARKMLKNGYESTSDTCLEILVDMLSNELKKIAQNAREISKCSKDNKDDAEIINDSLKVCGYDVRSLQNC